MSWLLTAAGVGKRRWCVSAAHFRRCALISLCGVMWTACGVEFDAASELNGLRVIGVQKSLPYARPGDTVELRLLYNNETTDENETVSVLWLGGCRNPPKDLYAACVAVLQGAFDSFRPPPLPEDEADDAAALLAFAASRGSALQREGLSFGFGESFSTQIPEDLIATHPPSTDPKRPRYGLEHVFFAACAGRLWFGDGGGDEFPIACYDRAGKPVSSEKFVVGYTTLFAYESIANDNPVVEGFEVMRGRKWTSVDDSICLGTDCAPVDPATSRRCDGSEVTIRACPDPEQPADCDKLELRPKISADSVGVDWLLTRTPDDPVDEQLWVSFHADRGSFSSDVRLVNDVVAGFQSDVGTEWIPPRQKGLAYLWAVLRDNRGGADWGRVAVCVD